MSTIAIQGAGSEREWGNSTNSIPERLRTQSCHTASGKEKLVAFLLGLGARLNIKLIGYLPFSELALIALFPLLFGRYAATGAIKRASLPLTLLAVWLGGQIFTDIYRSTDLSLAARGCARIIVFTTCIPFFMDFMKKGCYQKILWFTIGLVPSFALSAFVFRSGVHEGRERVYGVSEINWETHWGGVFGGIVLILCLYLYGRSRVACYSLAAGMGAYQILRGSRSTGGLGIFGVALTIAVNALVGRDWFARVRRGLSFPKFVLLVAVIFSAGYGTLSAYSYAASRGMLGDKSLQKYMAQSATRFGLIGGGRPGFICGLLAISESPWIGYGSWPTDETDLMKRTCDLLGVKYQKPSIRDYPVIPAHSQLLIAWVEAGFAGVFFWTYLLVTFFRATYARLEDERRLRWYITNMAVLSIWNILFSPISGRIETAMMLAVILNQTVNTKRFFGGSDNFSALR
jgi:O-antigen ligase